jgi:hypothetical protein
VTANLADPHFMFVWPSYALLSLVMIGLAMVAWMRLSHWARLARSGQDESGRTP